MNWKFDHLLIEVLLFLSSSTPRPLPTVSDDFPILIISALFVTAVRITSQLIMKTSCGRVEGGFRARTLSGRLYRSGFVFRYLWVSSLVRMPVSASPTSGGPAGNQKAGAGPSRRPLVILENFLPWKRLLVCRAIGVIRRG